MIIEQRKEIRVIHFPKYHWACYIKILGSGLYFSEKSRLPRQSGKPLLSSSL